MKDHQQPYDEYAATTRFAALDGLRAISVLLVIGLHTGDPMWTAFHGTVGVTMFFVISGWLITTLLLREEQRRGRANLGRFYLRRVFRLFPAYYVVLLGYLVVEFGLHLGSGRDQMRHALPFYLTYQNDLANGSAPFAQSWSLAVEEKFYLFWPLLVFALPALIKRRAWIAGTLLVMAATGVWWGPYFAIYVPLLLGCILALAMHQRRSYTALRPLTHPAMVGTLVVLLVAQLLFRESIHGRVHLVFSVLFALAFPGIIAGAPLIRRALSNRAMTYIGQRSYSLYLVHDLLITTLSRVFPAHRGVPLQVVHLGVVLGTSILAAEVLYRVIEVPGIRFGRRLAASERISRSRWRGSSSIDAIPGGSLDHPTGGALTLLDIIRAVGRPLGTDQIEELSGLTRLTVIRHLNALDDVGLVQREGTSPEDPQAVWRVL